MISVKCSGGFYNVYDTDVDQTTPFKLADIIQPTDKVIDCEIVVWEEKEGRLNKVIKFRNHSSDFENILEEVKKILLETDKSFEINLRILFARNRI